MENKLNCLQIAHRVNETIAFSPAFFWPKLGEWFPRATNWESVLEVVHQVQTFVKSHIQDHVENPPADGNPRDFLDAHMQEIQKTEDTGSIFDEKIGCKLNVANENWLLVDFIRVLIYIY